MYFNDRTSYIAAIATWKAAYAQHSTELRKKKLEFKQAQRDGKATLANRLRHEIASAKQKATEMIQERHDAKQEAQAQYLAAKAAKADKSAATA